MEDHYIVRVNKNDGGQPSLTLAPKPRRHSVQTMDQWLSAFQASVAVYGEKAIQDTLAPLFVKNLSSKVLSDNL